MNRFKIGLVALVAALLSGCGAGQISQTATQEPAVNGNRVNVNNVALRDIRIQAAQTGDFVQPGRSVDLVAVAINQSPDTPDRLVGITTDIGTVTLSGDGRLPAGGMLFIGTPEGQQVAPGPIDSNNAVKATVNLTKPISNGLNYNFTFNFEKAGQATVQVPISAGLRATEPQQHLSRGRTACHPGLVVPGRYRHGVAKARSQYRCSECRHVTAKWVGRCLECGTWGTVDEVAALSAVGGGRRSGRAFGLPSRPDHFHRARRQPAPLDGHRRTRPGARRRRGARLGHAAGGRSGGGQVDAAAQGRAPLGAVGPAGAVRLRRGVRRPDPDARRPDRLRRRRGLPGRRVRPAHGAGAHRDASGPRW